MPIRNVHAFQQTHAEQAVNLDKLRLAIEEEVAAFDRGEYTEIEQEDLDAYLDDFAKSERR